LDFSKIIRFNKFFFTRKILYFFEADSIQDDTTLFTGKYSYLEPLRIIREGKRKKQFDE
jgi:hypothetical protein